MSKTRNPALVGHAREETVALHRAITAGEEDEVHRRLEAGADPNFLLGMQGTALCNAIASGQMEIAEWLIENGCDVNAVDFDKTPPLFLAIKQKCAPLVRLILAQPKCKANVCDPVTQQPALLAAVELGLLEISKLLVDCPRYKVTLRDSKSFTALHLAVQQGSLDLVNLLATTADLKLLFNHDGMLPLHMAGKQGSMEIMEILCPPLSEDQPIVNETEDKKEKAQNRRSSPFYAADYHIDTPNMYSGWTALHFAVSEGQSDMVTYLLQRKVNVDARTTMGATPLLLASAKGDCDLVEKLLEAGADPNVCGEVSIVIRSRFGVYHMTPLSIAASSNNLQLARCLLEHGADINGSSGSKEIPLMTALKSRATAVACLLLGLPEVEESEKQLGLDDDYDDVSLKSESTSTSINQAAHVIRSASDTSWHSRIQEQMEVWPEWNLQENYCCHPCNMSYSSFSMETASSENDKASSSFPNAGDSSLPKPPAMVEPKVSAREAAADGSKKSAALSPASAESEKKVPAQKNDQTSTLPERKSSPAHAVVGVCNLQADCLSSKSKNSEATTLTSISSGGKTSPGGCSNVTADGDGTEPFPQLNVCLATEGTEDSLAPSEAKTPIARVDIRCKGETPLHAVAAHTKRGGELCRRLLDLGCPLDARNRHGNTALHEAVAYSNLDVVKALMEAGCDVNLVDHDGDFPLHLAAREGDVAVGKLLLSEGADPDVLSQGLEYPETPLRVALDSDNVYFVHLLLDAGCSLASESYLLDINLDSMEADLDDRLAELDIPALFYEDLDLLNDMALRIRQPSSLLQLSLNQVRSCFRQRGPGGFRKMRDLPLPSVIINKLMYAHRRRN